MKRWLKNVLYWLIWAAITEFLIEYPFPGWHFYLGKTVFMGLFTGTIFHLTEKPLKNFLEKRFGEKKKKEK